MLWEVCALKPRREDAGQTKREAAEERVSEKREVWRERPEQARGSKEDGERVALSGATALSPPC